MTNSGKFPDKESSPIEGIEFEEVQSGFLSTDGEFVGEKISDLPATNIVEGLPFLPSNGKYLNQSGEETLVSLASRSHSGQYTAIKFLEDSPTPPVGCVVTFYPDLGDLFGGVADIDGQTISGTTDSEVLNRTAATADTFDGSFSPYFALPPAGEKRIFQVSMSKDSTQVVTASMYSPNMANTVGVIFRSDGMVQVSDFGTSMEIPYDSNDIYAIALRSDGAVEVLRDGSVELTTSPVFTGAVLVGMIGGGNPVIVGYGEITFITDANQMDLRVGMGDIDSTYKDWCGNEITTSPSLGITWDNNITWDNGVTWL